MVLDWLTFAAAAVAAVGAVVGPVLGYRGVLRTVAQDRETSLAAQRQQDVDRYVTYALDDDPAVATMGVRQLQYLRETGRLTDDQSSAVAAALAASLDVPRHALDQHPGAGAVQGGEPPGHPQPAVGREQDDPATRSTALAPVEPVTVTAVEVQRARLVVSLGDALPDGTPTAVRTIAAARPRSTDPASRPAG